MAYKITEDCGGCASCEEECLNKAISEGEEIWVIDPDKCTECVGFFDEPQCAFVCAFEACVPDPEHEESKEELRAKYQKLHPGREPTGGWD